MAEKSASEVLEMMPRGVDGDEGSAEVFAGVIIDGEQEGLLVVAVHQGWMEESCCQSSLTRERSHRRLGLGTGSESAHELGEVGSGVGGDGLAIAMGKANLETSSSATN